MSLNTGERADEPKGAVHSASAATAEGLGSPLSPSESLIVIEPSRSWATPDLRALWAHRELLYFLIWRDLKVRYRQTLLGAATWIIIQPFLMMLIFTLFFGLLVRVPSDGIPYPVFVYAGLFLWTFFSNTVISSSGSIVGNSNLITKVYFPRLLIPLSTVGGRLVDLAITFLIIIGLTAYYEVALTWSVVMIPVLIAMVALLALGIGTLVSAWNVKYRDVNAALPVLVQFWFFASPIIYPASLVPTNWQWLYFLNPMAVIVENFRAALFGLEFNWSALGISVITILTILVCSAYAFRRVEKSFADII
jgi:lipopolysaccharide transport system permease protein